MDKDNEKPLQEQQTPPNPLLHNHESLTDPRESQLRNANLLDEIGDTLYSSNNFYTDEDQETLDHSIRSRINSRGYSSSNNVPLRPRVEWIYPSDYESSESEDEDQGPENDPSPSVASSEYIVDPNDVTLTIEVEGQVVQPRRYYLKIFGIEMCNDEFVCIVNPKILPVLLLIIIGIALGVILPKESDSNTNIENISFNAPSSIPSLVPSLIPVEPRVKNITELLHDISGDAVLVDGSSQSKALNWIIYDDVMQLDYNSLNLVQRYVLMVFFYELTGEGWTRDSGFGSAQDECDWISVECSDLRVGILILDHSNLKGKIPTEIGHLQRLQTISFMSNPGIKGRIPSEIGQLRFLESFRVNTGALTGTIPEEIGNIRSLKVFRVDQNLLQGTIPSSLGKLRGLIGLYLGQNQLTGTIPSELSDARILRELSLPDNDLTGTIPSELGKLTFLELFHLWDLKLVGSIPSSLTKLPDLKEFEVHENLLTGTIPSELYELPLLRNLVVSKNRFTGTIPNFVMTSSMLEEIALSNTLLHGTIPDSFGNFSRLSMLALHGTELSGTVPQTICDLKMGQLSANCAGDDPKVNCTCCTDCV